jgi:hypothetical protein
MSTDNGNVRPTGVCTGDRCEETRGANDIERGHTEEAGGVEGPGLLEYGGTDWYGAVYGVGDDEDMGFWCGFADGGSKVADDAGVGLGSTGQFPE